jgi:hypothetical protein
MFQAVISATHESTYKPTFNPCVFCPEERNILDVVALKMLAITVVEIISASAPKLWET